MYNFILRIQLEFDQLEKYTINKIQLMNSNRSSLGNSSLSIPLSKPIQRSSRPKHINIQKVKQKLHHKLASKYCTCQNYMTINQINRTLADKQCILKTTVNDIKFNLQEQKLEQYYLEQKSQNQLPQLIEYYKYYSQKSVLYIKQYFPLLYQYQQKRKVIQYNRLKVLLNLSESGEKNQNQSHKKIKDNNQSLSVLNNKSRIGISRNYIFGQKQSLKLKGFKGVNILDQLQETLNNNNNEESLLLNRLRNNLSKHIGPTEAKNMSLQQIDKIYNFTKKNDVFHTFKENKDFFLLPNGKSKINPSKTTKFSREQTHTTTPQQFKNSKTNIRRRSGKRNNSCQNLTRVTITKNPYDCATNKLRRKKNLSMDNIYTNTSTPYMPQQKYLNPSKMKKVNVKYGQKQRPQRQRQKQNFSGTKGPQTFLQSISDLKSRIKKQKQRLLNKVTCNINNTNNISTSYKRQKVQYTSINTANQRFTKKNYEKLRQKTVNNFI